MIISMVSSHFVQLTETVVDPCCYVLFLFELQLLSTLSMKEDTNGYATNVEHKRTKKGTDTENGIT